ncbi:MAG TPA: hypothetical protein IAA35_01850 [Candidatus Alistipes faecigallinarum]|nr:hypothetical protein [Candidatus Alistipes faecigallinarum]
MEKMNHDSEALALNQRQMDAIDTGLNLADKGMNMIGDITRVYEKSLEIKRDIALIQASTAIELKRIASQYELCQNVLQGVFGQRQEALMAHYKVLEKALEGDDRTLIIASLRGISEIVVSNPLESYSKFIEAWNDNSQPLELDF